MVTKLGIDDLLKDKRDDILRLANARKAYNVRVFGSVARGEAIETSDVDFLVTFEPNYTLWDHIGLIQDLAELLGRDVDVSTEETLKSSIKGHVLQEAKPL
jgi:predicted nucleotidyltransferase